MKNLVIIGVIILQLFVTATVFAGDKARTTAKCHMDFNLKGWSVFYKTAEGNGKIGIRPAHMYSAI